MKGERDEAVVPGRIRAITPSLPEQALVLINAVLDVHQDLPPAKLVEKLRRLSERWKNEGWSLELRAVALVLADLLEQSWGVVPVGRTIELRPPGMRLDGETREAAKERLRAGLRVHRARQLAEPGVIAFLQRMHRPVPRLGRRTSIADLIDDGKSLAKVLRRSQLLSPEAAAAQLGEVIRPVIQICEGETRCEHSGLRLADIWRYFRHTWSNEYRSIPGRSMLLLIRNAARPNWPVMGIAMLASPVVRLHSRDGWLGWTPDAFCSRLSDLNSRWDGMAAIDALRCRIEASLSEIRIDDLDVTLEHLAKPAFQTVLRMAARAAGAARGRQRELRQKYEELQEAGAVIRSQPDPAKGRRNSDMDWRQLSEDPLYVHKRADLLAKLLAAKRVFQGLNCSAPAAEVIAMLQADPDGERAISTALAEVRKAGLSSQVTDLSVCGAVAPYNELIGGKLVALLMISAEVRSLYRDRYADQVSIISSQMAGRPIQRPAELKVLTTTSLYGFGSVQYNALRLRACEHPELRQDIEWKELRRTMGWGTYHLTPETIRTLRLVSERAYGARRINNRFGEGASPRLRQTREGLEALGIDTAQILHHATPRIFYGCELYPGAIEELLGFRACSVVESPSAEAISAAWRRRWLVRRIQQPGVLERIARLGVESLRSDLLVPDANGQLPLAL
jgi:hypothetical protein